MKIKKRMLSEKIVYPWCLEYASGTTVKEIAQRENVKECTLRYWIRRLHFNKGNRRSHKMDESYFSNIDKEAKAYILGFLMADGCVSRSSESNHNSNRLVINISHKDRKILELIQEEFAWSYVIQDYIPKGTYSDHEMSRLVINSQRLCIDLAKYGIVPNKTGKECFPDLPEGMKRHFVRGFLDGDGSAYIDKRGRVTYGFSSCKNMLMSLREYFSENGIESIPKICHEKRPDGSDKHLYDLSYGRQSDTEKIFHLLYDDAEYYFERKKIY